MDEDQQPRTLAVWVLFSEVMMLSEHHHSPMTAELLLFSNLFIIGDHLPPI
jgi:hypothetical protein